MVKMAKECKHSWLFRSYITRTPKQVDTQSAGRRCGNGNLTQGRTRACILKRVEGTQTRSHSLSNEMKRQEKDEWVKRSYSEQPLMLSTHDCFHPSYFHHTQRCQPVSDNHSLNTHINTQRQRREERRQDSDVRGNAMYCSTKSTKIPVI